MDAILVLNAGSSSIKFAIFASLADDASRGSGERVRGQIDGIGDRPHFKAKTPDGAVVADEGVTLEAGASGNPHERALAVLLGFIERFDPSLVIRAVGHRVVHGGPDYAEPLRLDPATLAALDRFVPLAPLHQPHNLAGVRAAMQAFEGAPQVACFDTAFHRRQPWVADTFALPRHYYDEGVRRYGFHGLSYDYISRYLQGAHPELARGRVVVAHLGNGASLCAIQDGRAMGSTMGFTAVDGMPMGTRTGQLDPGVVLYLLAEKGFGHAELERLLYKDSGLLGLSGISGDWRRLEEAGPGPAADAMAYFTYRALREIGGLAATMGGLDALVFTAGIGENAAGLRRDIGQGLGWLGVAIDPARNEAKAEIISTDASTVTVLVVPTDEEATIAHYTRALLAEAG
jgi:acetate kinase